MITKLIIRNFKGIESLEVPLRPFTVLVGPNDSGKSTILQALEVLSRSLSGVTEGTGDVIFDETIDRYLPLGDRAKTLHLEVHGVWKLGGEEFVAAPRPYRYEVEFRGLPNVPAARNTKESLVVNDTVVINRSGETTRTDIHARNEDQLADLRAELSSFSVRFDPRKLADSSTLGKSLASDGSGLVALIDSMLTAHDKQAGQDLQKELHRFAANVNVDGLSTSPTLDNKGKELFFSLTPRKKAVSARQMSDGVLLVTAFLALRYGTSFRRYLVEEPENGIHPRAVAMVIRLLQELTLSGDRQVIATTHSPLLLNHVDPADVLVVTRTAGDGIRTTPLIETNNFEERSKDFDVGELWYNIGERELVRDAK